MRTIGRQSGFTLVEIAIVLVIIGLLLGGILKGQEMITQARIKNVINDFNGISAAYFSYQDRYRAIPGDDGGAAGRWATVAPTIAADSGGIAQDGSLAGNYNDNASPSPYPESRLFWWHLRLAGFIAGPTNPSAQGVQNATNAFGGLIGAQNGVGAATLGLSGLIICSSGMPDKVAIAVDTQLDDQGSSTGVIRARLATPPFALGAADANYAETGANLYVACKGV